MLSFFCLGVRAQEPSDSGRILIVRVPCRLPPSLRPLGHTLLKTDGSLCREPQPVKHKTLKVNVFLGHKRVSQPRGQHGNDPKSRKRRQWPIFDWRVPSHQGTGSPFKRNCYFSAAYGANKPFHGASSPTLSDERFVHQQAYEPATKQTQNWCIRAAPGLKPICFVSERRPEGLLFHGNGYSNCGIAIRKRQSRSIGRGRCNRIA